MDEPHYLPKRGVIVYSAAKQVFVVNTHNFELVSIEDFILGPDTRGNLRDSYPVQLGNGSFVKFNIYGYKVYDSNFKFTSWTSHDFTFFYQVPANKDKFYALDMNYNYSGKGNKL